MFEEPKEDPVESAADPANRAKEKADEFRIHAELAAVFEGPRKFDARLVPGLDAQVARDIQRTMARLEKSKSPDSPVLPEPSISDAAGLLGFPEGHDLSVNDYHIHRRPGEVMMVRWLEGDWVGAFYERMQAHFDAALEGYKEEERHAQAWKQDPQTQAFLAALDAVEVKMADRYLRDAIRKHNVFVLSTQTADEINIAYLSEYVMGVAPAEIVGPVSAPPSEEPAQRDLAWFYKLFSLRGMVEGAERMCFFAFLQKSDDDSGW